MREALEKRNGLRGRFTARVGERRIFTRGGYAVERLAFEDVRDERGDVVTDHVHFDVREWNAELRAGQRVQFDARVRSYWKGYHDNRRRDFRLSHPTRLVRLDAPPTRPGDAEQYMLEIA